MPFQLIISKLFSIKLDTALLLIRAVYKYMKYNCIILLIASHDRIRYHRSRDIGTIYYPAHSQRL